MIRISAIRRSLIGIATIVVASLALTAQTKITAPKNKYKLTDDVKVGQQAAAQAKKQLPMLNDENIDQYIEGIGARLVAAIPPEFQHKEFKYTFDVVNQKEINAFALPGGPMFLNRGMMEAAKAEAEMVGVMGHEISHVALRHGTAGQSKSLWPGVVGAIGQIGGAILGGPLGDAAVLGTQIGTTAWATKYSRAFESQADILGAQILARAGYDPREMANMFKTIEAEGGRSGPQWLSSHPNPGNRYAAITKEAASLNVQGNADTSQFVGTQARLKTFGPAYTAEQIAKGQARSGGPAQAARVAPPSAQWRTLAPSSSLSASLPDNWNRIEGSGATYAPQGALVQTQGGQTFTHGVQFGTAKGTGNLQQDTRALLNSFARGNPQLKALTQLTNDTLGGRAALSITLSNVSEASGQPEIVAVTTATLPDGSLQYVLGVAPEAESSTYVEMFRRVRESVRLGQ
jgi:hypothetical protein